MDFKKYERILIDYGFENDTSETEKYFKKYQKRYGDLLIMITLFVSKAVSIELGILDTRILENVSCLKTAHTDVLTPEKLDKVLGNLNLCFKLLESL